MPSLYCFASDVDPTDFREDCRKELQSLDAMMDIYQNQEVDVYSLMRFQELINEEFPRINRKIKKGYKLTMVVLKMQYDEDHPLLRIFTLQVEAIQILHETVHTRAETLMKEKFRALGLPYMDLTPEE